MRHVFRTSTHLPRAGEEVFDFFSVAENLQRITPPELGFQILTPGPVAMREGARIDYRLRLFGVGFRWRTETLEPAASSWTNSARGVPGLGTYPPFRGGGRRDADRGRGRLSPPLWPAGEAAYPLVRLQPARIFRYRRRRIPELLG